MRICLISREFPPDTGWGGVGAYTYQTALGLKRNNHDVTVISLAKEDSLESSDFTQTIEGIDVHRVLWKKQLEELNLFLVANSTSHYVLKSQMAMWKKFLVLHEQKAFDVVETPEHLGTAIHHSLTGVAPTLITLHTPHFKFVVENFHSVTASFDNKIICLMEKLSILSADLLASPSLDLANFVSKHTGVDLNEIAIVRNPVNTTIFNPQGPSALESNGKVKVLFVGRLEPRKGVTTLVKAISKVVKDFKDVEFILIGADTNTAEHNNSMRGYLEGELKKSDSLKYVQFIPHVKLTDMPSYYRGADLCVIPSIYDNAPYTCIEALASGKPVIVSTAGGTKEYVEENITGLMVPPENADALAQAIAQLVGSKSQRESFGEAARSYAEKNLDIEIFVHKKIELYRQAIERYKNNPNKRLYCLPVKQSLSDSIELLCSFDQMLFDILEKESIEFRIKTWIRLLKKRPKLALGKLILNVTKNTMQFLKMKPANSKIYQKLKASIESKHPEPFTSTREAFNLETESP